MSQIRITITTALLAVLTVSSVSGCSGNPKPAPSTPTMSKMPTSGATTSTTSSKPAPSPSQDEYTGPASVPMAARAHTDAGRIAFAKHYIDQINETGKNPQTGILEPLALPTCKTCNNYSETVASLQRSHTHYATDSFKILGIRFPQSPDETVVEIVCRGLRVKKLDSTGRTLETYPEVTRGGLAFYFSWNNHWIISKIKFDLDVVPGDYK
ncbi:hypothetical protein V3G39_17205 [Dermatophilaceae bacterium Sec6.4]